MNAIREKRLALGMRQKDLAQAVGVNKTSIGNWERGVLAPTQKHAHKMCELFQCTPRELGFDLEDLRPCHELALEETRRQQANREWAKEYRERRLALGLTRAQLAEKAGIHINTVLRIENGLHPPRWGTRQKIRRVLGMPEERYYTEKERNVLLLELLDNLTWIVRQNGYLIRAAHLDPEDVLQELAVCGLRAIDRFRPDGDAMLKTFVERNAEFQLKKLLRKNRLHGMSGWIGGSLPIIQMCSFEVMAEAGVEFEAWEDWDTAFAYPCAYEESRPGVAAPERQGGIGF